jgi:hypothetical protein
MNTFFKLRYFSKLILFNNIKHLKYLELIFKPVFQIILALSFFIFAFSVFSLCVFAQDSETVYIENITISVDSSELLILEESIEEIPVNFDIMELTESFLDSYEQVSLTFQTFNYETNNYFITLSYSSLTGYSGSIYFCLTYPSSFLQGLVDFTTESMIPFYFFHKFDQFFQYERKYGDWMLDLIYSSNIINLPAISNLSSYSSVYSTLDFKLVSSSNLTLASKLIFLGTGPSFYQSFIENLNISYYYNTGSNIDLGFLFTQTHADSDLLNLQLGLKYNLEPFILDIKGGYDIFKNNAVYQFKIGYNTGDLDLFIKIERLSEYKIKQDYYTNFLDVDDAFFDSHFMANVYFKTKLKAFILNIDLYYYYYYSTSVQTFDNPNASFIYYNLQKINSFLCNLDINWDLNPVIFLDFLLYAKYPSYMNQVKNLFINETFLSSSLLIGFRLNETTLLEFSLNYEIISYLAGQSNPGYFLNVTYVYEKNDSKFVAEIQFRPDKSLFLPFINYPVLSFYTYFQLYF